MSSFRVASPIVTCTVLGRAVRLVFATTVIATPALAQLGPASRPPTPESLPLFLPGAAGVPLESAVVALGRALFFDKRLSADSSIACASCHDPARAFTDGRRVSRGVHGRLGVRNTPTLVNRGYGEAQFWDGRAATLLEQVLQPIEHRDELGSSRTQVIARVAAEPMYAARFQRVLGDVVHESSLARALAAYVATIFSGAAPFDRYAAGDTLALSDLARLGRRLFDGRARCSTCHRGPNFTDEQFHNTGVAWRGLASERTSAARNTAHGAAESSSLVPADSGRFPITRQPRHLGAFKTPTLREIEHTAPYMHDGSIGSLTEVIEFYDRGGSNNPQLDAGMRPLSLTSREKRALHAFLLSLSGRIREGAW